MEYPICRECGAAVGDGRRHKRWHIDQERELRTVVDRTLRKLDRQVRMAQLDRSR